MADTVNVHREVVRIEAEQSAAKRTQQTTQDIAASIERMRASIRETGRDLGITDDRLAKYGRAARDAGAQIDSISSSLRNFDSTAFAVRNAADNMDELRDAAIAADRSIAKVAQTQQSVDPADQARRYGDVESRTRAITGAIGYVGGGSIEQVANVGAELLAVNEAAGLLRQELPELVKNLNLSASSIAAMSVAAVAIGTAALVARDKIGEWKDAASAAQQATVGQIDALKAYYDFIEGATTEDVAARYNEITVRRDLQSQLLGDLNDLALAIERGVDVGDRASLLEQAGEGAVRALDAVGLLGFGLDEVDEAINETLVEVNSLTIQQNLYRDAIVNGTLALNDAAAREREYANLKLKSLERVADFDLQYAKASVQQIDERLAAIDRERERTRLLIDDIAGIETQTDETRAAIEAHTAALAILTEEENALAQVRAQAVPAEKLSGAAGNVASIFGADFSAGPSAFANIFGGVKNAVSDITPELKRLGEEYQEQQRIAEEQAKLTEKLNALTDKYNQTLQREAEDFQLQRARDLADHYADLADLDAKYYADRESILANTARDVSRISKDIIRAARDQNKELERLAEDHARRMYEIERDSRRSQNAAARRLDGIALYEAQQARADAIDDQEYQYQTEKERREEDFQDRLRELELQRSERLRAGEQALRDLERQHNAERSSREQEFQLRLARENEDRAIRLQRQAQDYQQQRQALLTHYAQRIGLEQQHYQTMYSVAQFGMQSVASAVLTAWTTLSGQISSTPLGGDGAVGSSASGFSFIDNILETITAELGGP